MRCLSLIHISLTDGSGNFTIANLTSVSGYGSVFARSLLLALVATVICLIIAFPVGYFLSRLRVNKQHIMLMLVMLPMWMNFLLRTYAWMGLLSINGPVNAVLGFFGLGPYTMLNTSGAVVLGMVYNYVPYMIPVSYTHLDVYKRQVGDPVKQLLPVDALQPAHQPPHVGILCTEIGGPAGDVCFDLYIEAVKRLHQLWDQQCQRQHQHQHNTQQGDEEAQEMEYFIRGLFFGLAEQAFQPFLQPGHRHIDK